MCQIIIVKEEEEEEDDLSLVPFENEEADYRTRKAGSAENNSPKKC